MTRDDVIRMARSVRDGGHWSALDLINFGLFVAAAEREACVQVCEDWAKSGAEYALVDAIRARGAND